MGRYGCPGLVRHGTRRPGQNYVTLSSIDEDALGETLEVVWEIEPGAHVIEKAGLPKIDGQDDSDAQSVESSG